MHQHRYQMIKLAFGVQGRGNRFHWLRADLGPSSAIRWAPF